MALSRWLACIALFGLAMMADQTAFAQTSIRWEASIDSAKQVAAQSNRLVLVIFTAPQWCVACRGLEADLGSQPSVGQAIEANYVAVKINADYYPNTAKQFNVKTLPTTIVIAPTARGEVLDLIPQRLPLDQYIGRLNRVAEDARHRNGSVAQIAAGPVSPGPPSAGQTLSGPNPATANNLAPNGPGANASAAQLQRQPILQPQTAGSPNMRPVTNPQAGYATASNTPGMAYSSANATMQPVNPAMASTVSFAGPSSVPTSSNITPANPGVVNPASSNIARPGNPAAGLSVAAGQNPPVALDGFCPVRLVEKRTWTPGQKAVGAIHRGRTYLFAGEEERRKFMANPDLYAPVLSGLDVVAQIDQNRAVPGTREHGVQYNGHVYLFADEANIGRFEANSNFYAARAQTAMQTNLQPNSQIR